MYGTISTAPISRAIRVPQSGPVFVIWAMVNTTAWILGTTQALPWTTVLLFLVLFTCGVLLLYTSTWQ